MDLGNKEVKYKLRHVEYSMLTLMVIVIIKKFYEYSYMQETYCYFMTMKVSCHIHTSTYLVVFVHNMVIGAIVLVGIKKVNIECLFFKNRERKGISH